VFLRNCWYVAAWDYELIDGRLITRTLLDDHVLLYRGDNGQIVALHDRCPHRGALLSKGRREGDSVRCMYHGLRFDATGHCTQIPGQDMIPPKLRVRSYPIVERNHLVWIWMGDAAAADPSQIVDFPYLSDPRWKGIPDYLHYDANYLLIMDNLSDFAHLAFVHTKTLGGSEEYAFVTKPVAIERLERGFRVERWHMSSDAPPFHRKVIPDKTAKVDRRNIANMYIPGIFYMETMFAPAGQGADKGNLEGARQYRNCQFMTPETGRTTHFFWAYLNDFEGDDVNISRSLHASLIEGFMEDKAIIERQQVTLDEDPTFQMLAIAADAPLAHFRRVLGKLIDAEAAGAHGQAAAAKVAQTQSDKPKQAQAGTAPG
jgi:phenylpropionate dioxygenase-like ring-hydroxylating dioxygenase large terminal subunit